MAKRIFDLRDGGWSWSDLADAICRDYGVGDIADLVTQIHRRRPDAFPVAFGMGSPARAELVASLVAPAFGVADEVAAS